MPYTAKEGALASYLDRHSVSVEFLRGAVTRGEFPISQQRITLGRGPGVDLALEAGGLAREHAVIEFWGEAFVLRDVDTTHPVRVNGGEVRCAELKDGDRIELGELAIVFHCSGRL